MNSIRLSGMTVVCVDPLCVMDARVDDLGRNFVHLYNFVNIVSTPVIVVSKELSEHVWNHTLNIFILFA